MHHPNKIHTDRSKGEWKVQSKGKGTQWAKNFFQARLDSNTRSEILPSPLPQVAKLLIVFSINDCTFMITSCCVELACNEDIM